MPQRNAELPPALRPPSPDDPATRRYLRHLLATLAYRSEKALRAASPAVADVRAGPGSRTPLAIVAHMGDLMAWACSIAEGRERWHDTTPTTWDAECDRYFEHLSKLDEMLASKSALGGSADALVQGPLADALTHVGQIALLRRLASAPVRAENYAAADIAVGRVGRQQSSNRKEFD